MPERKIIVEEEPEIVPRTPEDIAAEVDARIGMMLRQLAVMKLVGQKVIQVFKITDLVQKCRDKLKSFNN